MVAARGSGVAQVRVMTGSQVDLGCNVESAEGPWGEDGAEV